MGNDHFWKAMNIAVWLAFGLILLGMIGGAILDYRPAMQPVAFVRNGILHGGPAYPQFGSPRPTERAF